MKVSERETELELQLADMTSQRDQGNEAMARMEERLWEMEERMARLAGENGALMDRVSRLEVRAKDAEDGKQAAHEYIALLEQNLAIASASAVANAQSNEEIMAGLQVSEAGLSTAAPPNQYSKGRVAYHGLRYVTLSGLHRRQPTVVLDVYPWCCPPHCLLLETGILQCRRKRRRNSMQGRQTEHPSWNTSPSAGRRAEGYVPTHKFFSPHPAALVTPPLPPSRIGLYVSYPSFSP